MDRKIAREAWPRELEAFTQRNAGRRTTLEVDALEIGAQEEEVDLPLRGVAYDSRDGRVEIMLGEQATVDRHLTRSITSVSSIDVVADAGGRDRALRVVHEGGQTVLRLLESR